MSERRLLPVADTRTTSALAWRLVRQRPWALATTVLAFLGSGLAGVVPVIMIGRVVDDVQTGADRGEVSVSVAVMIGASLVAAVMASVSVAALAQAVAPALAGLREDVLDRALHLETARIEEAGVGDVVSRVGDDVRHLTESLDEAVPALLNSVVAIVFTAGGLFVLDWRLGLAGLLAVPCYVLALRWYLPRSAPMYRAERTAEGERAEALVTGLHGAPTLRAYGREGAGLDDVRRASRAAAEVSISVFTLYTRFGARMNGSELVGLAAVLTAGYLTVNSGAGTVGEATAAALFFHRLFNPIGAVLFVFDAVQSSGAALARLAGVVDMPAREVVDVDPGVGPRLVLTDVHHAYEAGREVLQSVHLDISPGERVAIVGSTGAGKSTLGGIAAGTIRPTTGSVRLGGIDFSDHSEGTLRRHVALVSQEVYVFAGTLADNLRLAAPEADDAALWDALERTRSAAWARSLPLGLDTVVGELGHRLTPAQAQQVALTRVLLLDPVVVVMDEATAEAGSSGARDLDAAAAEVVRDRTALVVAHRLSQARTADRVVVMDHGRIVEDGTHDALVAAGGRYADLWAAWESPVGRQAPM